ncbi:aminomethyl-transferring glycine dehydrogenase subunit GcvPB [Candidatus Kapabacteria bacterium]|nr:aminomethyl-transferring glycine dehydrogenase subunit GcvPB [Candidatus Kapabacteria bacterium]
MEKLIFEKSVVGRKAYTLPKIDVPLSEGIPNKFARKKDARLPETSEIEVARHFQHLAHQNFNIEKGMYPLGSCTMKYNPKINEKTAALPGFASSHPLTNDEFSQGSLQLMFELGEMLKEITGLQGVSLQPAAGSQGELTGIYMFRAYHQHRNDTARDTILVPDSSHGTNPASAAIAGYKVDTIKTNESGRIDIEHLKSRLGNHVAGFMITNPSTVGLFESQILKVRELINECGGLMYMDGANFNALLTLARPGDMGFDCVHINLHKTFSTPHGGGGPGSGPVCVSERLRDYLPVPQVRFEDNKYSLENDRPESIGRFHTFNGNFGVLVRAYTYMRMLGKTGMRAVSENAVINANYLFRKIDKYFDVPFDDHCMHEFIISGNRQKKQGANTKDIGKRLLDYGFHAPTVYFPITVPEAMLIEPTETENKQNLDEFADAMISIAKEVEENPELVKTAPHSTHLRRLDEAKAARMLNISWRNYKN